MEKNRLQSCTWVEKKCPICEKVFIPHTEDWAYKRRTHEKVTVYFCSWGCLLKYEDKHPKKIAIEQREEIINMIRKGEKTAEIVRTLGVDRSKVRYWQERIAREVDDDGSVEG